MDCRVMLWLGKAIFKDGRIDHFHIGEPEQPPNAQRLELDRVVWKMLAGHVGHPLRVVLDEDKEFELLDDFVEIGGDECKDISFKEYLEGWSG
jgi:hypothetical protein